MSNNEVHSCNLRGKDYKKNILPFLSSVRNVAIEPSLRRLYCLASWTGNDIWQVVSIDYDGRELRVHAAAPRVTYGLGAHGGYVYWAPHEENATLELGVGRRGYSLYSAAITRMSLSSPQKILVLTEVC